MTPMEISDVLGGIGIGVVVTIIVCVGIFTYLGFKFWGDT